MNRSRRKLSDAEVLAICAEYEAGETMQALAAKYGLHYQSMRLLLIGHHYKDVRRPITQVRRRGPARRAA